MFHAKNISERSYVRYIRLSEAVRVRTDKVNFGPSPMGFIFSVKVNHYIQFTHITFIWLNSIFFILWKTVFKANFLVTPPTNPPAPPYLVNERSLKASQIGYFVQNLLFSRITILPKNLAKFKTTVHQFQSKANYW